MKQVVKFVVLGVALFAGVASLSFAESPFDGSMLTPAGSNYTITPSAELGFVKVLNNTIQIGSSGTNFNYVTQGGQEILFPYTRFSVDFAVSQRHHIIFLYQPLLFQTQTVARQAFTIDGTTFAAGVPVNVTYSFPFWRLSYLYDFVQSDRWSVGAGASVQVRNASIRFEQTDGTKLTVGQNLGIVPILKLRARFQTPGGFFVQSTVDGFYASSALFNGAEFQFEGSILDASLQTGVALARGAEAYLGLRFIGGTSKGNSNYAGINWTDNVSSFTENRLATMAVTLGASIH
jgi:hypothetical protein